MQIDHLRIRNFRCLEVCDLQLSSGINCIIGDNGSGKSSLLEAIHYLGRGRSFRHARTAQLIRRQADSFSLAARLTTDSGRRSLITATRSASQRQFKIDGRTDISVLDLVTTLPAQVIDPQLHRLIEDGPTHRRRYLDWGVFHVEHRFMPAWQRYRRALKQRNNALRSRSGPDAVTIWDAELVRTAVVIDDCRQRYLDHLVKRLEPMVDSLLAPNRIALHYHTGWPQGEDYAQALHRLLESDQAAGYTQAGPHRADFRIHVEQHAAKGRISRGQQKVLTTCLLLAQARLLYAQRGVRPILLIDDLAAELGAGFRHALMDKIAETRCQSVLTFLDADLVSRAGKSWPMFHVEHGRITP